MVYKVKGLPWSCGIGKNVSDCLTTQEVMKNQDLIMRFKNVNL